MNKYFLIASLIISGGLIFGALSVSTSPFTVNAQTTQFQGANGCTTNQYYIGPAGGTCAGSFYSEGCLTTAGPDAWCYTPYGWCVTYDCSGSTTAGGGGGCSATCPNYCGEQDGCGGTCGNSANTWCNGDKFCADHTPAPENDPTKCVCTASTADYQSLNCQQAGHPSGYTGIVNQSRTKGAYPGCVWSAWSTDSDTCTAPQTGTCTPATDTEACPSGQTGTITYTSSQQAAYPGCAVQAWNPTPTSNTCTNICTAPATWNGTSCVTPAGTSVTISAPVSATTNTAFTVSWTSTNATALASAFPSIGDANASGAVDIIDASQISRKVAGLSVSPSFSNTNADADQDGQITSADSSMVANYASGGTPVLPTPLAPSGCSYSSALGINEVNGSRSITCTTTGTKVFKMIVRDSGGTLYTGSASVTISGMTGTLTPAAHSCVITAGHNSCTINYSWVVTSPEVPSSTPGTGTVIKTVSPNATVASGTSLPGGSPLSITHGVPDGATSQTFNLYNNNKLLAQDTAIADCAGGTRWNGTVCNLDIGTHMTGTLTSSASCAISNGNSSCIINNFTWTTTNPQGVSSVVEDNYGTPSNGTGNSGANVSFPVQFGDQIFRLMNSSQQLAVDKVSAYCSSGSVWDSNSGTCVAGSGNPIIATCTSTPGSAKVNQQVVWSANVSSGGNGNYTYTWTGDGIPGPGGAGPASNQYSLGYDSSGTKNISVAIVDSGGHAGSCSASIKVYVKLPTIIEQ